MPDAFPSATLLISGVRDQIRICWLGFSLPLFSQKPNTHFTIQHRVQGRVRVCNLCPGLYTYRSGIHIYTNHIVINGQRQEPQLSYRDRVMVLVIEFLLSHSRSLKTILNDILEKGISLY